MVALHGDQKLRLRATWLMNLALHLDINTYCAKSRSHNGSHYSSKLRLYTSVVLPILPYRPAGETWTSVAKTRHMLDVFNRRCLRNILGISWKGHVSNEDLLVRTKVDNLHDTVDKRRRRFINHILHLPSSRPASAAVQWTPEGGKRKRGRPKKTWQDTLRDDLQAMDVDWEDAKYVAGDRREWRSLVAQCSSGNRRT